MPEKKPLSPDILVCGTTIRLISMETTRAKWSTILIGARPGRYIVVEMPRVAGGPLKLDDGSLWTANFIHRGSVYSFKTLVAGYTYRLAPLLFLEYPKEAEITALRTEKRYPVNIPMTLSVSSLPGDAEDAPEASAASGYSAEEPLRALVVDISEGGFMMASPVPIPPESAVEAVFYLPKEEAITGVCSEVKACRGQPGSYFVGLSYMPDTDAGTLSRIRDIITNIENMPLRL